MAKGIIYLMSTAVPGLIKIGKTTMANYSQRMYNLESNGYRNVSSLKRAFAIEVEGYDEKELLLHTNTSFVLCVVCCCCFKKKSFVL